MIASTLRAIVDLIPEELARKAQDFRVAPG